MKNKSLSWGLLFSLPVVVSAGLVWSAMTAIAAIPPAPIGAVDTLKGKGWGKTVSVGRYDKTVGDLVVLNEVLGTGKHSNMKLTFIDGTVMNLGEDAEIIVDEMIYDPNDTKDNRVVLKLGVGAFYFVSGKVAKDKVTIITPTATIGIRGTELVINVSKDGSTAVGVSKGHAYIDSRSQGGGRAEIEVGNTARSNGKGIVGKSFPGIDLTGDDDVDRNIPGVSDWLDDEQEEDEAKKRGELDEKKDQGEDKGEDAEDAKGNDGEDMNDEDRQEQDQAEFESEEDEDGKEIDLSENYGSDGGQDGGFEGDKGGGSENGKDGGDGDSEGSEGGDGGSEGGSEGSDGSEGGSDGSEGSDGGSDGSDGSEGGDDGGDDGDGDSSDDGGSDDGNGDGDRETTE